MAPLLLSFRQAARVVPAVAAIVAAALFGGCMGRHTLVRQPDSHPSDLPNRIAWFSPDNDPDRVELARWRRAVGPPLVRNAPASAPAPGYVLTVASWNIALGRGEVTRLVAAVKRRIGPGAPLVLLLQETFRRGTDVPAALADDSVVAARIPGTSATGRGLDILDIAEATGLSAYYAPSMRNGPPAETDEDRGNAILSNLPLAELTAIELPFEGQRRVAVAATVSGSTPAGAVWRLRVVSAHLDNMVGRRRLWVAGAEYARVRQARGLVRSLDAAIPTVLAADLNTWFGFSDKAYIETARAFPSTTVTDRRPTFRGILRLDHVFFRLPDGWRAELRRADERFGSDHFPLIATIRF